VCMRCHSNMPLVNHGRVNGPPQPPRRGPTDLEQQIAEVKDITGADDSMVLQLLELNGWNPERAIDAFLQDQVGWV